MIFASKALLSTGWARDVRIVVADGLIGDIIAATKPVAGDVCVDTVLPALANLHSHTFQRAMAGMTEFRAAGKDSFWTWRDLMYRFVDRITPDQIEAIAALVFVEMQEAGYASVGEFHYVHHQKGGKPYDDVCELSNRIFAAAQMTGIGLAHLPVLYTYGGAGRSALSDGQLRFGNDVDQFMRLVERARANLSALPADCRLGVAPHSLRATSPEDMKLLLDNHQAGPVHIHIAEQPREVADIEAWLGARPVEWLLANIEVDANWCLIHATHMTDAETVTMANSGVVAGLCPITEANLGDGAFNGAAYLTAGGSFGVGSDSNVRISMTEELRMLEYSQRLRDVARNILVAGEGSVGHTLYTKAAKGGAQALARNAGDISIGKLADLVAINADSTALCALTEDQLLDGLVFAASDNVVTDVWSAGRHCVVAGRHANRDTVIKSYRHAITSLLASV